MRAEVYSKNAKFQKVTKYFSSKPSSPTYDVPVDESTTLKPRIVKNSERNGDKKI